jgi:hypothetical protein
MTIKTKGMSLCSKNSRSSSSSSQLLLRCMRASPPSLVMALEELQLTLKLALRVVEVDQATYHDHMVFLRIEWPTSLVVLVVAGALLAVELGGKEVYLRSSRSRRHCSRGYSSSSKLA